MKLVLAIAILIIAGGVGWLVGEQPAPSAPASKESDSPASPDPVSFSNRVISIHDLVYVPDDSTVVDLSGRGLSGSLKAEVRQLTELRELNLRGNNFTGLPAEVGQLSKLELLILADNPFTGLPYELGNLQNLKVLDLQGTNYAESDLEIIKEMLPETTEIIIN